MNNNNFYTPYNPNNPQIPNSNLTNNQYNYSGEDLSILNKWNWGAFSLNIFWGVGNRCYITLLCLIPIVNLVMPFICGIYGNRWLYKTGYYKSPQELLNVQRSWNKAGIVNFIMICLYIVYVIISTLLSENNYSNF